MTKRDEAVSGDVVAPATVEVIVDSALNVVAFVRLTVKHTNKDVKQESAISFLISSSTSNFIVICIHQ